MDFWDLTKLLFQRWYLAVPMLVLTGAVTLWTVASVKPDYIATAYVQLIPPTTPTGTGTAGNATPVPHNPWLDLGLGTLSNAAIVTVQDQKVIDEMVKAGFSGNFTITMSQQTPLVTFEVIGETGTQATETARQLVERFDASVRSLQQAYGASPRDSITTRRLDRGTNLEESNSKVKRAMVAVAGAGVLMTVATTVGVDALLRRRAARRSRRAAAEQPATGPPDPAVPAGSTRSGSTPSGSAERAPASAGAADRGRPSLMQEEPDPDLTMAIVRPAARDPSAGTNGVAAGLPAGLRVEYQDSTAGPEPRAPAPAEPPIPSDATIVLPLGLPVKEHWAARDGEGKKRR